MEVLTPDTVEAALAFAGEDGARYVSGGTAIQLEWAKGLPQPQRMISLARLPGLVGLSDLDGVIRIGARMTLGDLIRSSEVGAQLPLLHSALKVVAGPAVRNLGTLGGNICGRTGCLLPALLALDATLEFATHGGRRRVLLSDWLASAADRADILIAVLIEPQHFAERVVFRKVGLRAAFTPSVINASGRLIVENGVICRARLAVGGGIVVPARLSNVEKDLTGRKEDAIDWAEIHAAIVEEISAPGDDFRSSSYRRRVAANALTSALGGWLPGRGAFRPAPVMPHGCPPEGEVELGRAIEPHRWHIRPDVQPKVRGELAYLTDKRGDDMLVGRILRAGVPHARILSIDTAEAERLPGVVAVVTHRDIAGSNGFGIVIQDQPGLCFDKVRYRGEAVAAVAATDGRIAEQALSLIRVEYELLPVVDDMEAALDEGAPRVHDGGNIQRELSLDRGDIAQGFAKATHIVEDVYVTPRQMHGFMETEGGYAYVTEDGTLHVLAGGQHGGRDRLQLSRLLGMPEEKIRVVTSPTGGAFGGKDELSVQPALALLALKARRPVRLHLSRAESVLAGQKRHPMKIRMKTACDAQGRLLAQEVDVISDAGAYASLGPGVLETALEHAVGPYEVSHISTRGRLAYTNNGIGGAFRGFGANQMTYAIECQMDRLAARCGLSPLEIRARNMRKPGTLGYLGQVVARSERLTEMLAAAEASVLWRKPQGVSACGEWITGTGMAMNYQGNGLGSVVPDPAGGRLALARDGLIEGIYGMDEIGQGLLTLIQASVSSELGCAREDVRPVTGDTAITPESGSTTASRGTYVVWASARKAAPAFSEQMRSAAAGLLGTEPESLLLAPGGFVGKGSNSERPLLTYRELAAALPEADLPDVTVAYEFPKTDYPTANARYIFAFGAALARVAISRVTGEVRVLDLHQHTAAGPVMDLAAYLGQIEGGAVQGLGFTITEDAPMRDAAYLTANLDTYMLPGIQDAPRSMKTFALEELDAGDELGPRGTGELGIGAITPAIVNAIAAALGHWPVVTPIPPETLLDRVMEVS